ncbi:MAG TPA: anthranilate phosphoribosyltransferase, partial [Methyloceanibacter sp.]|nr:anthranilate phosphoribosyltransferase [Methyloceanibacter sp.]
MRGAIAKVAAGESLSQDEAAEAFDLVVSGAATPAQIGGLLMAMRVRGETVDEIAGAARAMRAKVLTV